MLILFLCGPRVRFLAGVLVGFPGRWIRVSQQFYYNWRIT